MIPKTAPSDYDETRLVNALRVYYPGLRLVWKYTLSPCDAYSVTDALIVEIKSRHKHYDSLVLEESKLLTMQQIAAEFKYQALYVCETPEGCWLWDITNLQPEWSVKSMPYHTAENRPPIKKKVTYLKIQDGFKVF